MISKLDYLLELKKLKSLNELVIEDNPVLVLKESADILRSLPLKVKQKETKDQKINPNSTPPASGINYHAASAGSLINNKNQNIQGTPTLQSNPNYSQNNLLKSNYSMNVDLNNINSSSSGNFNGTINNALINNNSINLSNGLLMNNNLISSGNVNTALYPHNKSNQLNIGENIIRLIHSIKKNFILLIMKY